MSMGRLYPEIAHSQRETAVARPPGTATGPMAASINGWTDVSRDGTGVRVPPPVTTGFKDAIYHGRDAIEHLDGIRRGSIITGLIHLWAGAAGAAAASVGVGMLLPPHSEAHPDRLDREEWVRRSALMAAIGGPVAVLLTAGAQLGRPVPFRNLQGVNAMYFLGVGAFAGAYFLAQPVSDALEH